ncbi:Rrf2 family transcriptional regulator [Paenibacillus sp. FSL P4-0081]|uniref:RrF2 family transcriptional regulator n=1 Tax=Paenibacillus sp. FSL P4-0081 TaxID=1536769 RepID=UPI0004F5F9C2|nr:Rrf2 family transcriptional regulator [Paenibacillus sp. FSL P4-0081]AIQ28253.1 Rrf2 family transcriptional regulator [Paenibacillus sp. FSL P4-0081]
MRLTLYTDYSLRILMYLGAKQREELTTIQDISSAYGISKNHLMKVSHELGKAGYIETVRGRGGGIRLALAPGKINIGEVVRRMEDDFYLVECFHPSGGSCPISPVCGLKGVLGRALQAYLQVLGEYTLEDLLMNRDDLRAILQESSSRATPRTEDVPHPGYEPRSLPAVRGTGEQPQE